MKRWVFIAALAAASPGLADPEIRNEISFETGVRDSSRFDVNRLAYQFSLKQSAEKVPVEFRSEVRAFSNFSHGSYGLTENSVALRALQVSYWGDQWALTAGLQQLSWSETFGYQPVDIANARDFLDFGPLDHGRNRLPAWNLNGFYTVGAFKILAYLTPQGQTPRLPASFKGLAVANDATAGRWFTFPEAGIRISTTLADSNASIFAYRHLNRIPAFVAGAAGSVQTFYRPVQSFGATFSRGFSEVVLRADAIITLDHPVTDPLLRTPALQSTYSTTVGADWSPASVDSFTLGVQGQVDRFAVVGSDPRAGASVMGRKGFKDGKYEVEGKAFSRFRSGDYWFQLSGRVRLGAAWEWKAGGEWLGSDPNSPNALLGYTSRVSTQLSFFF